MSATIQYLAATRKTKKVVELFFLLTTKTWETYFFIYDVSAFCVINNVYRGGG